jgi:hypothetical protein
MFEICWQYPGISPWGHLPFLKNKNKKCHGHSVVYNNLGQSDACKKLRNVGMRISLKI